LEELRILQNNPSDTITRSTDLDLNSLDNELGQPPYPSSTPTQQAKDLAVTPDFVNCEVLLSHHSCITTRRNTNEHLKPQPTIHKKLTIQPLKYFPQKKNK